jgi:hypothetical protein
MPQDGGSERKPKDRAVIDRIRHPPDCLARNSLAPNTGAVHSLVRPSPILASARLIHAQVPYSTVMAVFLLRA